MASSNVNLDFAGRGRKRPQRNIPIERLHLDSENPRLPENVQGKSEENLLRVLYEQFYLDELAESMSRNGYFDEEPVVAVPIKVPKNLQKFDYNNEAARNRFEDFVDNESLHFTVVEGNRRLATVKLLLDPQLRQKNKVSRTFPTVSADIARDLEIIPVIIYPNRDDVVPYLGVRHIVGIEKWDPYAKARYIAKTIEKMNKEGLPVQEAIKEVQAQIGDSHQGVLKSYVSYRLLKQAEESFDYDIRLATANNFSFLTLAIGQLPVRDYIGLPTLSKITNYESPIPDKYINNLQDVLTWLFGDGHRLPVIKESRDITNYLKEVLRSEAAVTYLKNSYSLLEAYDRTDGEEKMVLKYIIGANRNLKLISGLAQRHKTDDIIDTILEAEKSIAGLKNSMLFH